MTRFLGSLLVLTLAALVSAACGDGSRAPSPLTDLPALSLIEEMRFGHSTDVDSGFASIGVFAVADDGTLYAFDRQALEVRVYDSAGRWIGRFGRAGQGPGEFRGASAIGMVGDTLWVNDGSNARISFFTRAGELIRTVPVRPLPVGEPPTSTSVWPAQPRRDGRIVGKARSAGFTTTSGPDTVRVPRLLFDAQGDLVDTTGSELVQFQRLRRASAGGMTVSILYRQYPADDVEMEEDTLRILVAQPEPDSRGEAWIEISRLDDHDGRIWTRRYSYTPTRFDAARRDASVAELADLFFVRGGVGNAEAERAVRGVLEFPDYLPFVQGAMLGRDGTLWLLSGATGTRGHWIVIAPDGTPKGAVELPVLRGQRIAAIRDGYLWIALADDDGFPYVARYRLEAGDAGAQ